MNSMPLILLCSTKSKAWLSEASTLRKSKCQPPRAAAAPGCPRRSCTSVLERPLGHPGYQAGAEENRGKHHRRLQRDDERVLHGRVELPSLVETAADHRHSHDGRWDEARHSTRGKSDNHRHDAACC